MKAEQLYKEFCINYEPDPGEPPDSLPAWNDLAESEKQRWRGYAEEPETPNGGKPHGLHGDPAVTQRNRPRR